MSKVVELYKNVQKELDADPHIKYEVVVALSKIINKVFTASLNSTDGFCYKFNIPVIEVMRLYDVLKLDIKEVQKAFAHDWAFPDNAYMYNDPYYLVLLLLTYYGIVEDNKKLASDSLLILMLKIWNGRKQKFLPYCNPDIMRHVVEKMMNNRHLLRKYDTPILLLQQYFVPSLLEKYGNQAKESPNKMQNLFSQSWARVDQLFAQNRIIDVNTGQSIGQGGILPLYKKAKEDGAKIGTSSINIKGEEGEPSFDEYGTTSVHDEIAKSITDYITLNPSPKYTDTFINTISDYTHVSKKLIAEMLKAMHNHLFYDHIHDLITLILARTNISNKNDICSSSFINNIKRQIISSKNNTDVKRLQDVLHNFTNMILKNTADVELTNYSNVHRMQIRNVIIYGLVFNMRKSICNQIV